MVNWTRLYIYYELRSLWIIEAFIASSKSSDEPPDVNSDRPIVNKCGQQLCITDEIILFSEGKSEPNVDCSIIGVYLTNADCITAKMLEMKLRIYNRVNLIIFINDNKYKNEYFEH